MWKIGKMFYKKENKCFRLMLAMNLLLFFIFTMVNGLTRSHHFFILEPLWMGLFFIAILDFGKLYKKKWWFFILLGIVAGGMLINDLAMLRLMDKNKGAVLSSIAIYDLNDKLEKMGASKVYAINFSLSAPIYYLSGGKTKVINLCWSGLNKDELNKYILEVRNNNDTYLIARKSNNYYWSKEWIDWLNKDEVLNPLLTNPENFGVKKTIISDQRGTEFYIISKCTLSKKDAKICQ